MSKKKPIRKIFENTPIESADVNNELTESVSAEARGEETSPNTNPEEEVTEASFEKEESPSENVPASNETNTEITESVPADMQNEETLPDVNPQEGVAVVSIENEASTSQDSVDSEAAKEETSTDDLLEDVRRSLIEEEGDKKALKWWQRFGRKAKKVEPQEPPVPVEIDLPSMPIASESVEEQELTNEAEEQPDEIDDLIDLLQAEPQETSVESAVSSEVEVPSESEPEIDFEELKKQAFRSRAEGEEAEPFTDVRSIALEGGEEVLVEVETKKPDPFQERLSAFENALKPYRQSIYIALAILGVGVAVVASLIIFNVFQRSRPQPVQEVSNLPYPTGVSLPGGWSFQLGKGTLQNGKWEPRGPEWLEGTEVCRWIALPWSLQLEAVIRTLNPKDPIDLVMSNNDKFVYEVYSVRQLSPEELQKVDANSPCLLLILTQPDAEKRWVLTALP
jgi:hypothetical protein